MNQKLIEFRKVLEAEIKTAEASLAKAVHQLSTAAETGTDTLDANLKETLVKYEAKREQAEHAGHRIKQFLSDKTNLAITKYEDWKTDREIDKLEKHADQSEQQAVDAIVVAVYALMEAEVAIMEALKSRKIAIEVAG